MPGQRRDGTESLGNIEHLNTHDEVKFVVATGGITNGRAG